MRTLGIIALAAVFATPVAALSITKVLSAPTEVGELSVQERENQFAEFAVQENEVFAAKDRGEKRSKPTRGSSPLFDKILDTQIG